MRVLIVGCGYVGHLLGQELVRQGHQVVGVRRSAEAAVELKRSGIEPSIADITRFDELRRLPGGFEWVVNLVSSSKGGASEYRQVYLQGTRNLIQWLAPDPPQKFVYTSSTGVYGQTDGSQVKEVSPTEPVVETSQILVQTEKVLLEAFQERKWPAVILRAAGIYGPGRGYYFKQFLKGEARMPGQGERIINMIHRMDLVRIIIAALQNGHPGQIYNAVDDEPVSHLHFFRWLAEALGKPMPPFSAEDEAEARKRGLTNKRVLNRKLKMELGYTFKYPTFRQGYTAEIQHLEEAGLLGTEPEPEESSGEAKGPR